MDVDRELCGLGQTACKGLTGFTRKKCKNVLDVREILLNNFNGRLSENKNDSFRRISYGRICASSYKKPNSSFPKHPLRLTK